MGTLIHFPTVVEDVRIPLPAILVKIPQEWHDGLTAEQLYERTRRYWKCNPEARPVPPQIALAVADGVVREVFTIDHWELYDMRVEVPDPTRRSQARGVSEFRRGFVGEVARAPELQALKGKSVRHLPFGSASPIAYVTPRPV